jgi:hypothetical protein
MSTDTHPTVETRHRSGFVGFLTSAPGVITACAGLLTAGVGAYQVMQGGGDAPPDITIVMPSPAPADPATSIDPGTAESYASTDVAYDETQQLIDQCATGDDYACTMILDALASECYDGYGGSCDVLYWVSPVDSDYEAYGATCGGRFDWEYAGSCGA